MKPEFLTLADRALAYQHLPAYDGKKSVCFLGGWASDMTGTKASFLADMCAKEGVGFTRFDYRGHGLSSDKFGNCTIGDWLDDVCQIFTHIAQGPQIIVGSSLGGWLALLLAAKYPERVAALIGIAAAPDFTEDLMWNRFSPEERQALERNGFIIDEEAPIEIRKPITMNFITEGRDHLILGKPINIPCPVRLLQGLDDMDVPWPHALRISEQINHSNVRTVMVKNGDHRLSNPEDLDLLWQTISEFL